MKWALTALLAAVAVTAVGCGGSRGTRPPMVSTSSAKYTRASSSRALVVTLSRQALAGITLRSLPRFLSPTRLAIYTWGSGSCPAVPDRLVVLNPHSIRIHLTLGSWRGRTPVARKPSNGACTTDLRTTTMAVTVDPKQIDENHPVTIRLYYYGSKKPMTGTAPPL